MSDLVVSLTVDELRALLLEVGEIVRRRSAPETASAPLFLSR